MVLLFRSYKVILFISLILLISIIEINAQSRHDSLTEEIRTEIRSRNYEKGWKLYDVLTQDYNRLNIPFDTTYGKASLYVAQSYIFSNKNKEAATHYQKAIAIMEKDTLLPPIYTMQCYLGIGVAYKRMSEFNTATEYYLKAKALVISTNGSDARGLHNIYNNLGNVYRILGDFNAAIENHEEAIRIRTLHYPPMDYHIGDSYNNLGLVYTDLNQNSKAIIYLQQALNHYQGESISEQARAAQAGYNIARIYFNLGNYEKCLEFLDPAIIMMEKAGGEMEFDYAEMLNTKTHVLIDLGKLSEAKGVLKQTIHQKSKYLHSEHINWTYTNNAAAELAIKEKDYDQAEKWYQENLEIYQAHYSGFHPEKVQVWQRLMQVASLQNDISTMGDYLDSLQFLVNGPGLELITKEYQSILLHEEAKYLFKKYHLTSQHDDLKKAASLSYESIFNKNADHLTLDFITQKLITGKDRKYADLAININSEAFELIG